MCSPNSTLNLPAAVTRVRLGPCILPLASCRCASRSPRRLESFACSPPRPRPIYRFPTQLLRSASLFALQTFAPNQWDMFSWYLKCKALSLTTLLSQRILRFSSHFFRMGLLRRGSGTSVGRCLEFPRLIFCGQTPSEEKYVV